RGARPRAYDRALHRCAGPGEAPPRIGKLEREPAPRPLAGLPLDRGGRALLGHPRTAGRDHRRGGCSRRAGDAQPAGQRHGAAGRRPRGGRAAPRHRGTRAPGRDRARRPARRAGDARRGGPPARPFLIGGDATVSRRVERPGVRDGYDRWSETYDTTPNPLVAMDRRHTLRALDPQPRERVLEAGSGTEAYLLGVPAPRTLEAV